MTSPPKQNMFEKRSFKTFAKDPQLPRGSVMHASRVNASSTSQVLQAAQVARGATTSASRRSTRVAEAHRLKAAERAAKIKSIQQNIKLQQTSFNTGGTRCSER